MVSYCQSCTCPVRKPQWAAPLIHCQQPAFCECHQIWWQATERELRARAGQPQSSGWLVDVLMLLVFAAAGVVAALVFLEALKVML